MSENPDSKLQMNLPKTMRQLVMASRPADLATVNNFSMQTAPVPAISDGEILVKTLYLGVAPVMLRYMINETDFERPLEIGDVMHGRGVGRVVASRHPDYNVGDLIQAKSSAGANTLRLTATTIIF